MPKADGKTFEFTDHKGIRSDFLETVEYDGNKQVITYETEEFSAVCPFSGLPDIGRVTIEYVPRTKILELKALKYYLVSFRNVGIYQEAVTDRLYKDIYKCLDPEYLLVKTVYNVRGGILSSCVMDSRSLSG